MAYGQQQPGQNPGWQNGQNPGWQQPGAYTGYPPSMQGMGQQPTQYPSYPQPNIICRPVAGEEEARAVLTDFSGAVTIMPDFAHGRIYTKSLNQSDGTAIFQVFQIQQPVPPTPPVEYAPLGTVQALAAEIEQLKQKQALTADKPAKTKGSADK